MTPNRLKTLSKVPNGCIKRLYIPKNEGNIRGVIRS